MNISYVIGAKYAKIFNSIKEGGSARFFEKLDLEVKVRPTIENYRDQALPNK